MSTINFTITNSGEAVRIDADRPRKKFRAIYLMDTAIVKLREVFGTLEGKVFTVSTTKRRGAWEVPSEDYSWTDSLGVRHEYRDFRVLDVCIEGVQRMLDLKVNDFPKAIYISKNR